LLKSLEDVHGEGPYEFDAVKLPHNGSANNVSIALVEALESPHFFLALTASASSIQPGRQLCGMAETPIWSSTTKPSCNYSVNP
jgi:hypothetical protein